MTSTEESDQEDNGKVNAMIGAGRRYRRCSSRQCAWFLGCRSGRCSGRGAGGAMAAHALRELGEEAANRLLGPREKVRVGGALAIAASKIRSRIERGETLRQEGFFEPKGNGCSDADEVAKSVLLKCQREAEEKKIPYMAFLIGNIAFEAEISTGLAHQIVRTAESLTYRQLCLLKIAALRGNYQLRAGDYRG